MNRTDTWNAGRAAALAACMLLAAADLAAGQATNAVEAAEVPELLRPVVLRDEGGGDVALVDPFRRGGGAEEQTPGEDGLMRTTMGEISSEFKILAIVVPADTNATRSALIQFHLSDEPIVVHEGDLVRVDRSGASGRVRGGGRARTRQARPSQGGAGARRQQLRYSQADADLEEELKKFVFYVTVKSIEPNYIEVNHNKKRPDETIRLNW